MQLPIKTTSKYVKIMQKQLIFTEGTKNNGLGRGFALFIKAVAIAILSVLLVFPMLRIII